MSDFEALTAAICEFRDARDWRQFHSLRNLITSLNLEAAELLELTQWKSDAEVQALVLAFNEDSQEGVIGVADADGRYELILAAEVGDEIAVWQRVGTTDGVPRVQTVPPP